jgi:hypothetical protein
VDALRRRGGELVQEHGRQAAGAEHLERVAAQGGALVAAEMEAAAMAGDGRCDRAPVGKGELLGLG